MLTTSTKKWLAGICIVSPAIFIIYFVYRYGITVPYWDQWEHVTLLEKSHNHTLTFTDFWSQHNEHRIFFPKIIMFFLTQISGWNIFLELCTNIVFASLSLFFLFSLLDCTQGTKNNTILKIITSFLIFSMAQYENWSWGWQIQIYMVVTGIIVTIWLINKWQGKIQGLVIAILAAVLANYSFGSGILIWPSALFMLIIQEKWKLKHIIIWIAAGFVTVASYYYKHTGSSFDVPMTYFLSHPVTFIQYVLGYLGASLAPKIKYANLASVILLIIIILSILDIRRLDKERLRKMLPWLTLILYVLMSAIITGMGRVHLGRNQSMSSRYTTISTLFVISAIVLLYNSVILNIERKNKASLKDIVFIATVTLAFSFAYINVYLFGIKNMKIVYNRINNVTSCFNDPDNASDEDLEKLYPKPEIVRQRIKILHDLGIEFNTKK